MIVAMMMLSFLVRMCSPLLKTLQQLENYDSYLYQDEIGIYQLQIELATGNITAVEDDCIYYQTIDNDCELSLVNRKLISQPGTLDFIHDISELNFEVDDQGIIILTFWRQGKEHVYPIGYIAK